METVGASETVPGILLSNPAAATGDPTSIEGPSPGPVTFLDSRRDHEIFTATAG